MRCLFFFLLITISSFASSFSPFTGKVTGNKVRLRNAPDLQGDIIKEMNKEDLLLVVAEEGDFYAVQAPTDIKGYIFRSYLIDDAVEANNVHIRLEPHTKAPIIGCAKKGAQVKGKISPESRKWFELRSSELIRLYISKDYITKLGGPDFLPLMEKRKDEVEALLQSSFNDAEAQCNKDFLSMDPQPIIRRLEKIMHEYADFPSHVLRAKEILAALRENYLNKKESHLQTEESNTETVKEAKFPEVESIPAKAQTKEGSFWEEKKRDWAYEDVTPKMERWEKVEKDLFQSWLAYHPNNKPKDFYLEQKANATRISGKLAPYNHHVKNKPGDYLLLENGIPIAYLYSTSIDLEKWIGKHVSLLVSPRPNHHFAFPAFYVIDFP